MGAHCYNDPARPNRRLASPQGAPKHPPFKVWVCKAERDYELDVVFVRDSDPTKMDWDHFKRKSTVVGKFNTLAEADACAIQHFRFLHT